MPAGTFAYHEDIRGLLEALGVERTYLMGVSFGARTAIDFTLAHPEMVDALIPVAPALGGYSWSEETVESMEEADRLAEGGDVAAAVELELRLWIDGPERTPDQVDARVRERVREMNAHNWAIATDAGIPSELEVPAIERRGEIRAPTLVVVGDRDVRDIGRVADLLVAGIPGARRAVIAGAAHHPNMERPEEFNRIVLDFLAGLSDGQKEGSRP
jgi:pimeloyl-ACP methyl ester carboxylesterase